jgi:hypothetical protein
MPGIDVTDSRLLAIQQATRGMDPTQAAGYLQKVADSGAVPGSLAYLMSMYQKVKALENMQAPQPPQGPMPTVKDQLEQKLGGGIASVPAPALERPDTFAGGGIVAFADGDYVSSGSSSRINLRELSPSEMETLGAERIMDNAPTYDPIELEKTRVANPARKRLRELSQEERDFIESQRGSIENERKRSKGQFFVEAGANLASSNRPFIGALASSFKDPAGTYVSGIRGLMDKELALKKEAIAAEARALGYDTEDADRMAEATVKRDALLNERRQQGGEAMMKLGNSLREAKFKAEELAIQARDVAARGINTPWATFQPYFADVLQQMEVAKASGDDKAMLDLQARFEQLVERYQATAPMLEATRLRVAGQLSAVQAAGLRKLAPNIDGLILAAKQEPDPKKREQQENMIRRQLGQSIPEGDVPLLIESGSTEDYIQRRGIGGGPSISAPTLAPPVAEDPNMEAELGGLE